MAITVNGNFQLNGADGNTIGWTNIDLVLSAGGTHRASWTLVQGSTATGNTINAGDNCTDLGGNSGWDFVAPVPVLFADDFEGAVVSTYIQDWTPTIAGDAWILLPGSSATGLEVRDTGGLGADAQGGAIIDPEFTSPDHEVFGRWLTNNNHLYICVRYVDIDNWLGFKIHGTGAQGLRVVRSENGVQTELENNPFGGSFDTWYRLSADGDTYTLETAGEGPLPDKDNLTVVWTDTGTTGVSLTETSVGVYANQSTGGGGYLNDFRAESLAIPTGVDVDPVTEAIQITTPPVDVQISADIIVNPVTESLQITTPPVTVQYLILTEIDVQTEFLSITTPPVDVETFADTTVNPDKVNLQIATPPVTVLLDIDVNPITEALTITTPPVDVQAGLDLSVNPITESLAIVTPPVTIQYLLLTNVDVQTEFLSITTPPVDVMVFEDTTVNPGKVNLFITTPPVGVFVGVDVDVNPTTEFLDIGTPRVNDITTPVEFLIATEAQPLQYQVSVGGDVQMRAQGAVNAWRNENGHVSTPFPAVISTQPDSIAVPQGGAINLSIAAIGAVSYQWYADFVPLIGETNSTLSTTAPNQNVTIEYTCLALNASGFGIRSKAGVVTVGTGGLTVTHNAEIVTHKTEVVTHG